MTRVTESVGVVPNEGWCMENFGRTGTECICPSCDQAVLVSVRSSGAPATQTSCPEVSEAVHLQVPQSRLVCCKSWSCTDRSGCKAGPLPDDNPTGSRRVPSRPSRFRDIGTHMPMCWQLPGQEPQCNGRCRVGLCFQTCTYEYLENPSDVISEGWKRASGRAAAKCATCCPVPDATSSTSGLRMPDASNRAFSASRMTSLFLY